MAEQRWPEWARTQLLDAVALAAATDGARVLAAELYERWFAAAAIPSPTRTGATTEPLAGTYRRAHAATAARIVDGVPVLDRYDRLGADGWWRTWNTAWRPRSGEPRLLLSPHADRVGEVVAELTARLRDVPFLLACPTDPARLDRVGSVVLHTPQPTAPGPELVGALVPLLRAATPPLCLPVAPGIALAQYPDNGMTFGEHRCHLVAMALRLAPRAAALAAIADVFHAHGVDPAAPYRSAHSCARRPLDSERPGR